MEGQGFVDWGIAWCSGVSVDIYGLAAHFGALSIWQEISSSLVVISYDMNELLRRIG